MLIPAVLTIVALGEPWLALLVSVVAAVSLEELYRLFSVVGHRPVRWAGYAGAALILLAAALRPSAAGLGGAAAAAIALTLVGQLARRDHGGALTDWALTLSGTLYVAWTMAHLILLRDLSEPDFSPPFWQALGAPPLGAGAWWILSAFLMVWLCDTAAYFVGARWGRHKMSPYVSPKKSWEGAVAGFLTSVGVAVALVPLLGLPLSYGWAALLGALVGIVGQVGDLAESLLKRQVGVKDSGKIIPGHGGMLDRVDSLLFAVPAVYYFLQVVLR